MKNMHCKIYLFGPVCLIKCLCTLIPSAICRGEQLGRECWNDFVFWLNFFLLQIECFRSFWIFWYAFRKNWEKQTICIVRKKSFLPYGGGGQKVADMSATIICYFTTSLMVKHELRTKIQTNLMHLLYSKNNSFSELC